MALKYKRPNAELQNELLSVAFDAQNVIKSLEQQNFIPPDFPTATLIDICETLVGLSKGTDEGCRVPLEYARGRLPAIRRNHFILESDPAPPVDVNQEPQLVRGMSLDRNLSSLIASITTALDEYRSQASEQYEDPMDKLAEVSVYGSPDIASVVSGADRIESAMHDISAELEGIAAPGSVRADALSRTLRDTEGLVKVSKAELNFGTVVLRWYKSITQAAKKMPKVILASARAIKIGIDIAKSFGDRWLEMCANLFDFGIAELDKWVDTAIDVATKLQHRIDGSVSIETRENSTSPPKDSTEFDSESLYREGFVSYIEKRGLYGFLVDSENTRYFLPLAHGHLRTGQVANMGAVARFRFSHNDRGLTAIEVSFIENSIFSLKHGVIRLSRTKFDFGEEITAIALDLSPRGRVSAYKLRSQIAALFKSPLPLEEMLGYVTFSDFIASFPRLTVSGEDPNLWIDVDVPMMEEADSELSLGTFERWLLDLLSENPRLDGILLSRLGLMARAHFNTQGRIPAKLGFQTYVQVLASLDSVKVVGSIGGAERVVLSSVANDEGLELVDGRTGRGGGHALTKSTFDEWILTELSLPKNSGGLLFSRIGLEAQNHFAVNEKIPPILGFRDYSSLLRSIEGVAVLGSAPRQLAILRSYATALTPP